jgi:hypothetical protein
MLSRRKNENFSESARDSNPQRFLFDNGSLLCLPAYIALADDECDGQKFLTCAVATDFAGKITGYTVNGYGGQWRDYTITDVQYTTEQGRTYTSQIQLL